MVDSIRAGHKSDILRKPSIGHVSALLWKENDDDYKL